MSKQKKRKSDRSISMGEKLLIALTQKEIAHLLDALLKVLSSELKAQVLAQLPPDTRQTIQQLLSPAKIASQTPTSEAQPRSLAKLEQLWSQLWQKWDSIVAQAAEEEGRYIEQEVSWEPPYFDNFAFIEDLEEVAEKMQPLLKTAFENRFIPPKSFACALREAETEISDALPEWMDKGEGFELERYLTICLLEWESLIARQEQQDAFGLAERIREWEEQFDHVFLESNAIDDFFTQLSEAEQRIILKGLTANQKAPLWKETLSSIYSHWYSLYKYYINQYAPERYLDTLRATIPQKWENGLPVIEELLANKDYQESLSVIEATLESLLKLRRGSQTWTPETSLLFAASGGGYGSNERTQSETTLLRYYQQTALGLGQSERANALELQSLSSEKFFDWPTMFKAFESVSVSESTRQALFQSWKEQIVSRATPRSGEWGKAKSSTPWWLDWLIESIAEPNKGASWFVKQLEQWLASLPARGRQLGDDYGFLRLLTKDVMERRGGAGHSYPQFSEVVVRATELSTPDDAWRQAYLQRYASDDLWDRVMAYWKEHLPIWIPRPEMAEKSDYRAHAQWMAALRELSPSAYETLLSQWRRDHQRRRNLWKAIEKMGLG